MTEPEERLLSPLELSDRLNGIPTTTLAQWRHRGLGPKYLRIGRHARYRAVDVELWLAEQYAGAGKPTP
jgi:hypothetical protein